jgi:hypothetical protein
MNDQGNFEKPDSRKIYEVINQIRENIKYSILCRLRNGDKLEISGQELQKLIKELTEGSNTLSRFQSFYISQASRKSIHDPNWSDIDHRTTNTITQNSRYYEDEMQRLWKPVIISRIKRESSIDVFPSNDQDFWDIVESNIATSGSEIILEYAMRSESFTELVRMHNLGELKDLINIIYADLWEEFTERVLLLESNSEKFQLLHQLIDSRLIQIQHPAIRAICNIIQGYLFDILRAQTRVKRNRVDSYYFELENLIMLIDNKISDLTSYIAGYSIVVNDNDLIESTLAHIALLLDYREILQLELEGEVYQ